MNFKNILLSCTTGALLLTTSALTNVNQNAAIASPNPLKLQNPIRQQYIKELNLTDDQQAKITEIMKSSRQQMRSVLTPEQQEKITAARQANTRPKDLNLTDEQKTQLRTIRKDTRSQVMAVLTPEQKDKLEKLIQERKESRQKNPS